MHYDKEMPPVLLGKILLMLFTTMKYDASSGDAFAKLHSVTSAHARHQTLHSDFLGARHENSYDSDTTLQRPFYFCILNFQVLLSYTKSPYWNIANATHRFLYISSEIVFV